MRSAEIRGLAVFSITDGKEIGRVKDLLINPVNKSVDYLIVDIPNWYFGAHVVRYDIAAGIGKDAVMVEAASALKELNQEPSSIDLVDRGVKLTGSRVLTRNGVLVGEVIEYYVDTENGQITGCELLDNENEIKGIIPRSAVVTFGRDVLVVDNDIADKMLQSMDEYQKQITPVIDEVPGEELDVSEVIDEQDVPESDMDENASGQDTSVKLFEQRQREYLLGRVAKNSIKNNNGNVIIKKGEVITQELIDQVTLAGKFKELMLDV